MKHKKMKSSKWLWLSTALALGLVSAGAQASQHGVAADNSSATTSQSAKTTQSSQLTGQTATLLNSADKSATTTSKNANVTVANSHSNLHPEDSFAYAVKENGATASASDVHTTPVSENAKVDYIMQPASLTGAAADAWLALAKQAATLDYAQTGREQQITMVDATVAKITIGSSQIPSVSAIDVSSYQSWMTQSNYNRLKQLGVRGVVVKITEGTGYHNPYAASQIRMAKAAGLKVSVYHYATFTSANSAKSEANYTASQMKALGLSKSTLIFADMEENSTINTSSVQSRLNSYWSALKSAGYSNHGVYTSSQYTYTKQMVATVGSAKAWIAQYPYNPSKNSMLNSNYGAWQFSSTATLPGSSNYLDVSHDYKGLLTGGSTTNYNTPIGFNKYVTVTQKSGSIWSNFKWQKRANVSSYYQKTFDAKVVYYNSNGGTYYSLYDSKNNWVGYINAGFTKVASGKQGAPLAANKYVTIGSRTGSAWGNFSGKSMSSLSAMYHKTYQVKVSYHHFDGSVYYSLYDSNGKWHGYVNAGYTQTASGPQGIPLTGGQYVTVMGNNGTVWKDFAGNKKSSLASVYHKTFFVKTLYHHVSGATYYSLYDDAGKWYGYINAGYAKTASGHQGVALGANEYVTLMSKNGSIWRDFSGHAMSSLASKYHKTYHVRVVYHHVNGSTYYSLYDNNNKWAGYVNAGYAKVAPGSQGVPIGISRKVTVTGTSGIVWGNWNHRQLASVKSLRGQVFTAKVVYYNLSGQTYYSLYDSKDKWRGYINAVYVK